VAGRQKSGAWEPTAKGAAITTSSHKTFTLTLSQRPGRWTQFLL
jgi:hypothetical protein